MTHVDFFNVPIDVGDFVVAQYAQHNASYAIYEIIRVTEKMVETQRLYPRPRQKTTTKLRYACHLIKVDPELVTLKLLQE